MTEIQLYLTNGIIFGLALMLFMIFKSWFRSLEHRYRIWELYECAKKEFDSIKQKNYAISQYEIDSVKKALRDLEPLNSLSWQIESFRKEVQQLKEEIGKMRKKDE